MKHLSDLARESWAKYPKIEQQLIQFNTQGEIIGCCVLGAIAISLGIEPVAINRRSTSSVAFLIDQTIGCEVLYGHDKNGQINWSEIVAMNDARHDLPDIFAELDKMELENCHGSE